MLDRKTINDRRAALIAHVRDCAACRELAAIRMGQPTPDGFSRETRYVEANRKHFEEMGMVPTQAQIMELTKLISIGRLELGKKLAAVDELPQAAYARYESNLPE